MLTPAGSIQTKIMLLENFCAKNVPFWGISLFFQFFTRSFFFTKNQYF